MPLLPAGDILDLDLSDESDPDTWWRRAQLPEDIEAPEADVLEQEQPVEFDDDGEPR